MKTTWKRIITAIICAVIAITSIETSMAYAAKKKIPFKVAFNGTSVSLFKDINPGDYSKLKTVEKKWGKPSKKETVGDSYATECTWKKGKTSIHLVGRNADDCVIRFSIDIKDKNGALCGIKVGMKKETALKKMQNMFGKKNVTVEKYEDGQSVEVPKSEQTGDDESIIVYLPICLPIVFELKGGRVSYMHVCN